MNEHTPASSAADAFAGAPAYESITVARSKRFRQLTFLCGLLVGLGLPMVSMLYDPYGYDIVCTAADRICVISEHHAFETVETKLPLDQIRVIQGHIEWDEGDSHATRTQTGRYALTFETHDGRSIDASLYAFPEQLDAKALRAFVQAPTGPRVQASTRAGLSDLWALVVLALGGLLLMASAFWRTVISLDPAAGTLRVVRYRWPLLRRETLHAKATDIRQMSVHDGEWGHAVTVTTGGEAPVRVAYFLFPGQAGEVLAALRALKRRATR